MSASSQKHVVRMGPITVLTLVIVLSLATMSVLSFTTAQAASRMANKQEVATQALYSNEVQAQDFLKEFDKAVEAYRNKGAAPEEVLAGIQGSIEGMSVEERTVQKSFSNGTRTLTVKLILEDDLSYTIDGWKTTTQLEVEEKPSIWQGA